MKAVAALAKRAEQHYGCPQDVEWALEDGDVRAAAPEPPGDRLVAQGEPPRSARYSTGIAGIVDTLINPLAARRSTDDRAGD